MSFMKLNPKGNFQFSYPFMPQEHLTLLILLLYWENCLSLAFLALCSLVFLPTILIIFFSVSMTVLSLHPLSVLHNLSPTPGFITTCSLSLGKLTHTQDFHYPLYPWSICGVHMCTLKYHS